MPSKPKLSSKPKDAGKSIYFWVFTIISVSIIVYFVTSWMSIRNRYKPIFDWWDSNDGADFNSFINIFTYACSTDSNLWYMLSNLSNPPSMDYSLSQYEFITESLMPYIRYTDPSTGSQMGILTPKSLTRSLLFSTSDTPGDVRFMNWFKKKPQRGDRFTGSSSVHTGLYTVVDDSTKPLSYYPLPHKKTAKSLEYWFYGVVPPKSGGTEVNIYPIPDDRHGWAGLLLEWLNGTSGALDVHGNPVIYCCAYNTTGSSTITEIRTNPNWKPPVSQPSSGVPKNYIHWLVKSTNQAGTVYYGQGDNFMARFGINADSPIFTFFINDTYEYDGITVDTSSYKQLVGGSLGLPGGWCGFLQSQGNWNKAQYNHLLYSIVQFHDPQPPQQCHSSAGHSILTGIGAASGILSLIVIIIMTGGVAAPEAVAAVVGEESAVGVVGGVAGDAAGDAAGGVAGDVVGKVVGEGEGAASGLTSRAWGLIGITGAAGIGVGTAAAYNASCLGK